jgi:hypothetical protein
VKRERAELVEKDHPKLRDRLSFPSLPHVSLCCFTTNKSSSSWVIFWTGCGGLAVDLPTHPVLFGAGVDPEFDYFVGGTGFGGC